MKHLPKVCLFPIGVDRGIVVTPFLGFHSKGVISLPKVSAEVIKRTILGQRVVFDGTDIITFFLKSSQLNMLFSQTSFNEIASCVKESSLSVWFVGHEDILLNFESSLSSLLNPGDVYYHQPKRRDETFVLEGVKRVNVIKPNYKILSMPKECFAGKN